jgi:hypothetical protein
MTNQSLTFLCLTDRCTPTAADYWLAQDSPGCIPLNYKREEAHCLGRSIRQYAVAAYG